MCVNQKKETHTLMCESLVHFTSFDPDIYHIVLTNQKPLWELLPFNARHYTTKSQNSQILSLNYFYINYDITNQFKLIPFS